MSSTQNKVLPVNFPAIMEKGLLNNNYTAAQIAKA